MNVRRVAPTAILVVLAVFTTAFAFINYGNMVKVWPLVGMQRLTLVIFVAFALGAGIGALLSHLLRHGSSIRSDARNTVTTDYREPTAKT